MSSSHFPKILGTASLNEKGQIVIPVEARNMLGLGTGSRIVLMSSPNKPALMLIKAEEVEAMIRDLADALNSDKQDKPKN